MAGGTTYRCYVYRLSEIHEISCDSMPTLVRLVRFVDTIDESSIWSADRVIDRVDVNILEEESIVELLEMIIVDHRGTNMASLFLSILFGFDITC